MDIQAEQTPADARLPPRVRRGVPAEANRLLKDIEVLRQLLAFHGEPHDSRGRSVFAQAVEAVIDERLTELEGLVGSA